MALADFGVVVSPNTVARLLHKMGYSLHVNHKKLSTDFSPHRDKQFLYLTDLRQWFQRRRLPIISVDTKKRELVGNFRNPGASWELSPVWSKITISAPIPPASPYPTASMMCGRTEAQS